MRDTILVGPTPPPYVGQSLSFGMLIEGFEGCSLPHTVVDLCPREEIFASGKWSFYRAWEYIPILFKYALKVPGRRKNVYLTIAGSRVGLLRDAMMVFWATLWRCRMTVHLKGGNYDDFYAAQPRWLKWLIRAMLRQTDAILVLSEHLRKMYDFEPALKDRIHVVHNGLPFVSDDLPASGKHLKAAGPIRLLYLSNLIESKGYFDVLEAVRIMVKEYGLNVKCRFCGSFLKSAADDVRVKSAEQAKQLFMDFVREHDLGEAVEYVGMVTGKQKQQELRDADFFVLPTNYNIEGQPVCMIEAIAYGCVMIATRYRALPDMVVEGRNGSFVEYQKPRQIADAVGAISRDPDRFHQMSSFSLEHFKQHFTREAHLNRIIPLITADNHE